MKGSRDIKRLLGRGIVLVDKPARITSRECVDKVQEILGVGKAGHAGTLDSNVTGLLLVALAEATKTMPVLMGLDKEYVGKMHLHGDVEKKALEKACKKFVGKIKQLPPVKSRVVRKERIREVYSLDILKIEGRDVGFKLKCEAGFYVRKFCHDFGQELGHGAHMTELRRTKVGPFSEAESSKLEDLKPKHILELEPILDKVGLKKILVKDQFVDKVKNGVALKKEGIERADKVKIGEMAGFYHKGRIFGLGTKKRGFIKVERIIK